MMQPAREHAVTGAATVSGKHQTALLSQQRQMQVGFAAPIQMELVPPAHPAPAIPQKQSGGLKVSAAPSASQRLPVPPALEQTQVSISPVVQLMAPESQLQQHAPVQAFVQTPKLEQQRMPVQTFVQTPRLVGSQMVAQEPSPQRTLPMQKSAGNSGVAFAQVSNGMGANLAAQAG